MFNKKIILTSVISALTVVGTVELVSAQEFPTRPIELISAYSPGGGSDISARIFAQCLEGVLPEKVVVRNITGGAGAVAEDAIFKERPTGYKLLWQHQSLHALSARGATNHAPEDFDIIGQTTFGPWGLFANAQVPFDDIPGMKEYIEDNPGELKLGAALGGLSHFASLILMQEANMEIDDTQIIGLSGSKNRVVAILKGNLDAAIMDIATAKPYIEADQLKSIAVMADEPVEELLDAETAKQQGVDVSYGVNMITWAPKGTPDDVLSTLRDAWKKAAEDPACNSMLKEEGFEAMYRDPNSVEEYNVNEMNLYRGLIKDYNVE